MEKEIKFKFVTQADMSGIQKLQAELDKLRMQEKGTPPETGGGVAPTLDMSQVQEQLKRFEQVLTENGAVINEVSGKVEKMSETVGSLSSSCLDLTGTLSVQKQVIDELVTETSDLDSAFQLAVEAESKMQAETEDCTISMQQNIACTENLTAAFSAQMQVTGELATETGDLGNSLKVTAQAEAKMQAETDDCTISIQRNIVCTEDLARSHKTLELNMMSGSSAIVDFSSKLEIDEAKANRNKKTTDALVKSKEGLKKGTGNAGLAFLEFSRAVEDAQYGMRGVLNNIPQMVLLMGMSGGVAGAVSIAAVAFSQLYDHMNKSGQEAKALREGELEKTKTALDSFRDSMTKMRQEEATAGYVQSFNEIQQAIENAKETERLARVSQLNSTKELLDSENELADARYNYNRQVILSDETLSPQQKELQLLDLESYRNEEQTERLKKLQAYERDAQALKIQEAELAIKENLAMQKILKGDPVQRDGEKDNLDDRQRGLVDKLQKLAKMEEQVRIIEASLAKAQKEASDVFGNALKLHYANFCMSTAYTGYRLTPILNQGEKLKPLYASAILEAQRDRENILNLEKNRDNLISKWNEASTNLFQILQELREEAKFQGVEFELKDGEIDAVKTIKKLDTKHEKLKKDIPLLQGKLQEANKQMDDLEKKHEDRLSSRAINKKSEDMRITTQKKAVMKAGEEAKRQEDIKREEDYLKELVKREFETLAKERQSREYQKAVSPRLNDGELTSNLKQALATSMADNDISLEEEAQLLNLVTQVKGSAEANQANTKALLQVVVNMLGIVRKEHEQQQAAKKEIDKLRFEMDRMQKREKYRP